MPDRDSVELETEVREEESDSDGDGQDHDIEDISFFSVKYYVNWRISIITSNS